METEQLPLQPASNSGEDAHECTICLLSYLRDQGTLICKHSFCYNCIETWSKTENTCPLCKVRFSYIERISPSDSTGGGSGGDGKKKSKAPRNKRTKVKKASQKDAYARQYQQFTAGNHLPFNVHHILQNLIASRHGGVVHRRAVSIFQGEDDDEDDEDDEEEAGFPFGHPFGLLGGPMRRLMMPPPPPLFRMNRAPNAPGNSADNPIELLDDEPPAGGRGVSSSSSARAPTSSSSSSSAAVIDLQGQTGAAGSARAASSAEAPIDLTVEERDARAILELLEDELDEMDGDYTGTDEEEEEEEEEDEDDGDNGDGCTCGNCWRTSFAVPPPSARYGRGAGRIMSTFSEPARRAVTVNSSRATPRASAAAAAPSGSSRLRRAASAPAVVTSNSSNSNSAESSASETSPLAQPAAAGTVLTRKRSAATAAIAPPRGETAATDAPTSQRRRRSAI